MMLVEIMPNEIIRDDSIKIHPNPERVIEL
jgi:hypothetical protein